MGDARGNDMTLAGWSAWHRRDRSQAWRQVLTADSYGAAVQAALCQALAGDWTFLPCGKDPNSKPMSNRTRVMQASACRRHMFPAPILASELQYESDDSDPAMMPS
jgi:hypothetical protein